MSGCRTARCNVPTKQVKYIRDAKNIVDGRKTYNVYFLDGTMIEYMYDEEIVRGVTSGVWGYDEDLKK
jgi:hypothetical protein